jgi:hypothetical protein
MITLPDTVKNEADAILETLNDEFGTTVVPGDRVMAGFHIDAKDAITWMIDNGKQYWSEIEWASYYIRFLVQDFCTTKTEFQFRPEIRQKVHRIRGIEGNHLWEFRLHNIESEPVVILSDALDFETDVNDNDGLGIIILIALMYPEENHEIRDWVEAMKGGPSDVSRRIRDEEGRPSKIRKKAVFILEGRALFISPSDIPRGLQEGWLVRNFQEGMRNSDQMPRNPKYMLLLDDVPSDIVVARRNLNLSPDEDAGDFY